MDVFIQPIRNGGPMMLPLLGMFSVCIFLFALRLRRARKHELPGLGLALVSCIIAIGLFGAIQGEIAMFDAVAHTSAEHKMNMFTQGRLLTIIPLYASLVLASIVNVGFCTIWVQVRHLELPSPRGALAVRILGYSSALLSLLGIALYFYIRNSWALYNRNWQAGIDEASAAEVTSFAQNISTLMFTTLVIASVACLSSVLSIIGSLVSGLRAHQPTPRATDG